MKVLFHCHTANSPCSNIREQDLVNFLNANQFDVAIITDHNVITKINWPEGIIIPASEIATSDGDVIGLFLTKNIPKKLSIAQTSDLIHSQGGLVVAVHPCDNLRKEAMGVKALIDNIGYFDIIETYNSRNLLNTTNKQASEIARINNLPGISGADAHTIKELNNNYMEITKFSNQKEFLNSLKNASFKTGSSGLAPHIKTFIIKKIVRLRKRLR